MSAYLKPLQSSEVGAEVRGQHARQCLNVGRTHLLEHLRPMLAQEGDHVLLLQ